MTNPRILLVEDEAVVALSEQFMLETLGYEVTCVASTGEEAIEAASRDKPDLVLMDVRLRSGMDGIEAAQEIRRRIGTPVVFITALGDENVRRRAAAMGHAGYVLKPFTAEELKHHVDAALKSRATNQH